MRSGQSLREPSGADQWTNFKTDFIGPLHWFPVATDLIARLSQEVDRGPNTAYRLSMMSATLHTNSPSGRFPVALTVQDEAKTEKITVADWECTKQQQQQKLGRWVHRSSEDCFP